MTLMQSAITLKDLSSVLASQGIRGTELTVQVIINFNFNFIHSLSVYNYTIASTRE